MAKPEIIYLYRITHIDNLDFILKSKKLTCPTHDDKDLNYVGIGDKTLITSRSSKKISAAPNGSFNDYIAFYFGARSPMLYGIQKGFNGVTKRKPESIIYFITTFKKVVESGSQYVFTDGHGYHAMSQFFNKEDELKEVDWKTVNLVRWNDTEDDSDRKRRKQAEFLILSEFPLSSIVAIAVHNEDIKTKIMTKFAAYDLKCNVVVKPKLYY
jgi:hypothetical protein